MLGQRGSAVSVVLPRDELLSKRAIEAVGEAILGTFAPSSRQTIHAEVRNAPDACYL